ncbi:hypothetical protein AVEN_193089-1 [Araneus ventricosus]|uniref:Secreted protein n=1 Tax=Araneus ventricosus TaxID=182803 RepID=A0A4Y2B2D0_ARAVE|nr:hypothetical protein AVEN_193089-1 [Araneus ventricosus]
MKRASCLIFVLAILLFRTLFHHSGTKSAEGFVRSYEFVSGQLVAQCSGCPTSPQPQELLFLISNRLWFEGNGTWPVTNIISGLCQGEGVILTLGRTLHLRTAITQPGERGARCLLFWTRSFIKYSRTSKLIGTG